MINSILDYFESRMRTDSTADSAGSEHRLQLATAALLVEMTRADNDVTAEERHAVDAALREVFDLDEGETRDLVRLAEQELDDSASLFQFTRLVDTEFPMDTKIRIVELLWRVAYSDTCKDKHEEHLVRKIADLLHVPHPAFIRARHRVEAEIDGT